MPTMKLATWKQQGCQWAARAPQPHADGQSCPWCPRPAWPRSLQAASNLEEAAGAVFGHGRRSTIAPSAASSSPLQEAPAQPAPEPAAAELRQPRQLGEPAQPPSHAGDKKHAINLDLDPSAK